jgi:outer membrane protein OmpA-like peptidoglycan-associated protein
MIVRFQKLLIGLLGILLLISCVNIPKNSRTIVKKRKKEFKVPISYGETKYLYSVLVDKKTEKFVKELLPNQQYDKSRFEEIKVYNDGASPYYIDPAKISEHNNSMFRDALFDVILRDKNININKDILFTTDFDKKKFLRVANNAIKRMKEIEEEKYKKVKFDIDFKIESSIYTEYATATVLIHHRPSLQLKRAVFYINGSAMYAKRLSSVDISRVLRKEIYKVGLPTGKNRVRANFSSLDNKEVNKIRMVENIFKGKPTFHVVAIGINRFPNWYIGKTLKNAVSDANYLKETFQKRSNELFRGRINIKPYSLDTKSTTKESITKLIDEVGKNVKPNDYFLLYVASHGILKGEGEDRKYYFAPSDFNESKEKEDWSININNGFGENEISEYLKKIPSIFRIAILDTCYAGKEVDTIKEELRDLPFAKKNGISVLTAAKSEQLANDKYKGHGLFTYILVDGLNGKADFNGNGVVDSIEIAQYVQDNVGRISRSETKLIQDAMVIPEPTQVYTRRFDLTLLEGRVRPKQFQPNIFTPMESQLYIDAINRQDKPMMNGVIRNNTRHSSDNKIEAVDTNKLNKEQLANKLAELGSVDVNIHFAKNSDKLTTKEIAKLAIVAKALKDATLQDKRVSIEGHTDWDGEKEFNMKLSQKRANSVTKLLEEKFGIDGKRLTSLGWGDTYPVASNETEEGKAQNRRVTIFVYE